MLIYRAFFAWPNGIDFAPEPLYERPVSTVCRVLRFSDDRPMPQTAPLSASRFKGLLGVATPSHSSRTRLRDTHPTMPEESTTPDPLEMLRRSVEAGSRRDFDAALAPFSPDGVWDMSPLGMGVFKGHEAIRGFFEDWTGAYEEYEIVLDEIHDLGNGVTFGVIVQRGRPCGSVGFVELRYATISTWADGQVERSTHYTDIDEARAAAERLAKGRE